MSLVTQYRTDKRWIGTRCTLCLADTFTFHYTQCGKCCIHRDDILLSPKDLFNIAKKFGITPKAALTQYCEAYIRCNSRFLVVCLKPQRTIKRCPLLKNRKCMYGTRCQTGSLCHVPDWHSWQVSCASYRWQHFGKSERSIYWIIFNNPECDDGSETHTVREWFHNFDIPVEDDYFFTWIKTQATLCNHLHFLEEHLSEKTMLLAWNTTLISLYLDYNITEDFQTQFQQNSAKILSLIETMMPINTPVSEKE